jgi:hypothetical protein
MYIVSLSISLVCTSRKNWLLTHGSEAHYSNFSMFRRHSCWLLSIRSKWPQHHPSRPHNKGENLICSEIKRESQRIGTPEVLKCVVVVVLRRCFQGGCYSIGYAQEIDQSASGCNAWSQYAVWLAYSSSNHQTIVPQISCVEGVFGEYCGIQPDIPTKVVSSGRLTHYGVKCGTRFENRQKWPP